VQPVKNVRVANPVTQQSEQYKKNNGRRYETREVGKSKRPRVFRLPIIQISHAVSLQYVGRLSQQQARVALYFCTATMKDFLITEHSCASSFWKEFGPVKNRSTTNT
jgi:hypothetical protein